MIWFLLPVLSPTFRRGSSSDLSPSSQRTTLNPFNGRRLSLWLMPACTKRSASLDALPAYEPSSSLQPVVSFSRGDGNRIRVIPAVSMEHHPACTHRRRLALPSNSQPHRRLVSFGLGRVVRLFCSLALVVKNSDRLCHDRRLGLCDHCF